MTTDEIIKNLTENTIKYQDIIDKIYEYFIYNISPIYDKNVDFKIYVSSDVKTNGNFLNGEKSKNPFKGCLLLPNHIHKDFLILISEEDFNKPNIPAIANIIHELTHLNDFILYAKEFLNGNYFELWLKNRSNDRNYDSFYNYSEFHAYYNMPYHYIHCLESYFDFSLGYELHQYYEDIYLPYQNNLFDIDILNNNISLYRIMAYIGKYATCNDIIGKKLDNLNNAPYQLKNNKLYVNIYNFLYSTTKINYPLWFIVNRLSYIRWYN